MGMKWLKNRIDTYLLSVQYVPGLVLGNLRRDKAGLLCIKFDYKSLQWEKCKVIGNKMRNKGIWNVQKSKSLSNYPNLDVAALTENILKRIYSLYKPAPALHSSQHHKSSPILPFPLSLEKGSPSSWVSLPHSPSPIKVPWDQALLLMEAFL